MPTTFGGEPQKEQYICHAPLSLKIYLIMLYK
ncbi:hypothetical protein [Staphylococcus aureus]